MAEQQSRLSIVIDSSDSEGKVARLRKLLADLSESGDDASDSASDLSRELKKTGNDASGAGKRLNNAGKSAENMRNAFRKAKTVAMGLFGGIALATGGIASQLVPIQREFDVLNAQLVTATGSTEAAAKQFEELKKFAATTPYDLQQAVGGFAKLKNLGLDPTIESMTSFGNTASAMGVDLTQVVEAVADASNNEFERLKEAFGITSKQMGDKVAFTFQGVTTTVGKNAKEIQDYLIGIGNTNFGDAMSNRMDTLDGAISNLKDSYHNMLLTLSQSGIGDIMKESVLKLSGALGELTEYMQKPETVEMFRTAIESVGIAFGYLKTAVSSVTSVISTVFVFFREHQELTIAIASGVGAVAGAFGIFFTVMKGISIVSSVISTVSSLASTVGLLANPVGIAVVALGALVAAGVYVYRNWDEISAKAKEIWGNIQDAIGGTIYEIVEGAKQKWADFKQSIVDTWQNVKDAITGKTDEISTFVSSKWDEVKNRTQAIFASLPTPVQNALNLIKGHVQASIDIVRTIFSTGFEAVKALVRGDIEGVKSAISSGLSQVVGIVRERATAIWQAFQSIVGRMAQIGKDVVQGLINGIKSSIGGAISAAKDMASQVSNTIKNFFVIRSPSRLMQEYGQYISIGLAKGIDASKNEAVQSALNMAKQIVDATAGIEKEMALFGNDSPVASFKYDREMGKYAGVDDSVLNKHEQLLQKKYDLIEAEKSLQEQLRLTVSANESVFNSVEGIQRQIALLDNDNPIDALNWDIEHTKKYANASAEAIAKLRTATEQLYEVQQANNAQKAFDGMSGEMQSESPMGKLISVRDKRLQIIQEALDNEVVLEENAQRAKLKVLQSFADAKRDLLLSQSESLFGNLAGMTEAFAGKQSNAYRALFAIEKGFAIAQSAIAIQASLAKAMQVGLTPIDRAVNIASAISQGAQIVSTLQSINPKGFMNGGYTGNLPTNAIAGVVHGQEYVFDANATKRIGVNNLERIRRGEAANEPNITIINNGAPLQVERQEYVTPDEMRVYVTQAVPKVVSGEMNKPTSQISKSLQKNFSATYSR